MHLTSAVIWWCLFLGILFSRVSSKTASSDVNALNVMFKSLNTPQSLSNWKAGGGDPCGESWKGITCDGASVTEINLSALGLSGKLGYQLSNLASVTNFDVSKNNLNGDLPYQLPPNLIYLDLSYNAFSGRVPYSISLMKALKYLNIAHNQLSGQLEDMFSELTKLNTLDLSSNSFNSSLPQSFRSLSGLRKLYLQNNRFSGQINMLGKLKLKELNLENNRFSGWIPSDLVNVDEIEIGGNPWSTGQAPPGMVTSDKVTQRSTHRWQTGLKWGLIAVLILGILLGIAILISLISRRQSSFSSSLLDEHDTFSPRKLFSSDRQTKDFSSDTYKHHDDGKSFEASSNIDMKTLQHSRPVGCLRTSSNRIQPLESYSDQKKLCHRTASNREIQCLAFADLQNATANFASERLLGEGTTGRRVYKAKYDDGKMYAVSEMDSSILQEVGKAGKFSEIVASVSKLRHPNIAELVGYCSEKDRYLLVYEYLRNGSLHEFLHLSDEFSKPLTWNTRVRIALETARAVEYLHENCSPPVLHMNIKSSNILLDMELNPHLCDCGLATLYQLKGSEDRSAGYRPPQRSSSYTQKDDVYSFGIVMLELLTGRLPFDRSKPPAEQSLVEWARPHLQDKSAIERMADPALRGLYPERSLCQFAGIIVLCVKREPESRPAISEVAKALAQLVQR